MNEMELRHELKALVAEAIEIDDFNDDDNFATQLGVDSLMAVEIVARAERHYHIHSIPNELFVQMNTLNDLVRIIMECLQTKTERSS